MIYPSTRLGEFDLPDDHAVEFPDGLYGFENRKKFGLIPLNPNIESSMEWLHSLEDPDLTFVVTDPYIYKPDYKLALTDEDKQKILVEFSGDVLVRVIVTIPKNPQEMTGNLIAPIVINPDNRMARQFVLTRPEYDTRHPLLSQEPQNTQA